MTFSQQHRFPETMQDNILSRIPQTVLLSLFILHACLSRSVADKTARTITDTKPLQKPWPLRANLLGPWVLLFHIESIITTTITHTEEANRVKLQGYEAFRECRAQHPKSPLCAICLPDNKHVLTTISVLPAGMHARINKLSETLNGSGTKRQSAA